jgi:hypothetical protein
MTTEEDCNAVFFAFVIPAKAGTQLNQGSAGDPVS